MRHVAVEERRSRLGRRHLLAAPGRDVTDVTRSLVALHSSDPTTVFLTLRARVPGMAVSDVEDALYRDREIVRFYGMRRTLWVVDRDMVAAVHHSSTRRIGERERARTIRIIEEGGVSDDGAAWLDEVVPEVLAVIEERGEALARELTAAIPRLEAKVTFHNKAGRLMGTMGMSTRALTQLALESRVLKTRPVGSWISSQYRWAETESWLRAPIEEMSSEEASARLLRRWLLVFGPATETDIRWWTGWPAGQVRKALSAIGAVEVELDDGVGYLDADDLEPVASPAPWVAALPSLDPTTMGWKERGWYLEGHDGIVFDRNGNAGQTIWVDGVVVGGWAQRKDGVVDYRLLTDVGTEAKEMIESALGELELWLGDVRFRPRFGSPLDRELAG